MSLFNVSDLNIIDPGLGQRDDTRKAFGLEVDEMYVDEASNLVFLSGDKMSVIADAIGDLDHGNNIFFLTDGAWSNIDLIGYILNTTGPARLFFTTWSIAADTISKLGAWKDNGQLFSIHAILDQGIRNRKPEILQLAMGTFANLKLTKIHAKVTVIQNEKYSVVLMGSANFTKNPRKEIGMIIKSRQLADANIKWILEEFS